jgi:F-type H+-transporting ATPase subunit b
MLACLSPVVLLASGDTETDILQRSVNFIIFAAIIYYLLADKVKVYFSERTSSIQSELDKVQEILKESEAKVESAKNELEEAKRLADEIVEGASKDISIIKSKIEQSVEQEIASMSKSFDDKVELETRKVKTEVVSEILDELLNADNIELSQEELTNIVLKKVA